MSAAPKLKLEPWPGQAREADRPPLRLHRCRLDYAAALREYLHGGCASRVARAAGSEARSRRNLRRVGLKIVTRLKSRYDVLAMFDQLGFTVVDFCREVIELVAATKTRRHHYRGRLVGEYTDPDFRTRLKALRLYLEATGIMDLPV